MAVMIDHRYLACWIVALHPLLRRPGAVVLLLAAPVVLAIGCDGPGADVPASQAAPVGNGPPIGGVGAATARPPRPGISTTVTALGTVVTNDGFTLYRYAEDRAAPPRSTCTGGCATTWPPVVAPNPPAGTGLDPALLGSVGRPDGTRQLTVNGWPVYRFARDAAPGDVRGQGVGGGAWTAIGFDGRPVEAALPTATAVPARKPASPPP